jgi:hypothetical protein
MNSTKMRDESSVISIEANNNKQSDVVFAAKHTLQSLSLGFGRFLLASMRLQFLLFLATTLRFQAFGLQTSLHIEVHHMSKTRGGNGTSIQYTRSPSSLRSSSRMRWAISSSFRFMSLMARNYKVSSRTDQLISLKQVIDRHIQPPYRSCFNAASASRNLDSSCSSASRSAESMQQIHKMTRDPVISFSTSTYSASTRHTRCKLLQILQGDECGLARLAQHSHCTAVRDRSAEIR